MRARARRAASGPRGVPRRFFHPCGREKSGVVKVNGVKLMNFEEKLDCFFFYLLGLFGRLFEETEVVCRRMLKKILKCFREDVIVEEFIQASGEILIYFFMKVTILSFYAS